MLLLNNNNLTITWSRPPLGPKIQNFDYRQKVDKLMDTVLLANRVYKINNLKGYFVTIGNNSGYSLRKDQKNVISWVDLFVLAIRTKRCPNTGNTISISYFLKDCKLHFYLPVRNLDCRLSHMPFSQI